MRINFTIHVPQLQYPRHAQPHPTLIEPHISVSYLETSSLPNSISSITTAVQKMTLDQSGHISDETLLLSPVSLHTILHDEGPENRPNGSRASSVWRYRRRSRFAVQPKLYSIFTSGLTIPASTLAVTFPTCWLNKSSI